MKILYVTANLPFGTDEAFLVPEIEELLRLGHEVLIVPRSPDGPALHAAHLVKHAEAMPVLSPAVLRTAARRLNPRSLASALGTIRGSRTLSVALKNLAVLPKAAWLASLADRWGAEHIHCHWAGTTATMAMFASAWTNIPWSLTLHRWDIVEQNLLAEKAGSAKLVRFISEDGLLMGRSFGVPAAEQVRVIHMGVPLHRQGRQRLDGKVVVCPARLVEVKGHKYLLEAWRTLLDRGVQGHLWLAGDGPLRPSLEAQAASLGLSETVQFLGTVPHATLLKMYQTVGIAAVVLPSVDLGNGCHEGIPVALIEAMSVGIPVVGTNTGGTPELLRDRAGIVVNAGNAQELSTALEFLLTQPEEQNRLGERGRSRVETEFDVVSTTRELVNAFEGNRANLADRANSLAATRAL